MCDLCNIFGYDSKECPEVSFAGSEVKDSLFVEYIKGEKFYSNNPLTEGDLKESVQCTLFSITSAECLCVTNDVFARSCACLQAELNHFQRSLKCGEDKM
jgi:hypothetical protein